MICPKCTKSFIQIGRRAVCPPCYLDMKKSTLAERMAEAMRWLKERGITKVTWRALDWKKRGGYDVLVEVPDVGYVRVGLGHLGPKCEMSITVTDKLLGYGDVRVRFRCARSSIWVKKEWKSNVEGEGFKWPGVCICKGCNVRRYVEGCKVDADVL